MSKTGEIMREKASERVSAQRVELRAKRQWTGQLIYQECRAMDVFPAFAAGKFLYYVDMQTNKKAITRMPPLVGDLVKEYHKAQIDASREAVKEVKKKKIAKLVKEVSEKKEIEKDQMLIKVIAKKNPRKPGCQGYKAFAIYRDGMTVAEYHKHKDAWPRCLAWDIEKGFIKLVKP